MSSVNIRKSIEFIPEVEQKPVEIPASIVFGVDTPEHRVAHKLYMARCRLRWTQQELATSANAFKTVKLTQQRISELEQGRGYPQFLEVAALARAMSLSLEEFNV